LDVPGRAKAGLLRRAKACPPARNRAAAEKHCKLALCGVIGEVRRLFEIGDFTQRFLICQTQADGIGQLRQ
jgi:hypothetical protein